ncbi:TRAP transporter substrate-binding protein [Streptomyces chartreusis]|uniref:TRAP transporter substrate-binding protein n=1 Tax=Streptomyces chartreusis TaxID=1969 RepID=UPI00369D8B84
MTEPLSLRCAHDMPAESTFNRHIAALWAEVTEATRGEVNVEVVAWGASGNSGSMLAQTRRGVVHFYPASGMPLASECPIIALEGVPYAFDSDEHAIDVFSGPLGDRVRQSVREIGLVALPGMWPQGHNQIPTVDKTPFPSLAAMAGFPIRTADSPFLLDLYASLGMDPQPVHLQGVRDALEQGRARGVEMPPHGIEQLGVTDLHRSMTLLDIRWANFWMTVHAATWARLSTEHQQIVTDASGRHAAEYAHDIAAENRSALARFSERHSVGSLDHSVVRESLTRAGFYERWRDQLGADTWALLESETQRSLR